MRELKLHRTLSAVAQLIRFANEQSIRTLGISNGFSFFLARKTKTPATVNAVIIRNRIQVFDPFTGQVFGWRNRKSSESSVEQIIS